MNLFKTLRLFAAGVVAVATVCTANAEGTINIQGITYVVDTLYSINAGPGTTSTSLRLTSNEAKQLQVHYLTIDKTIPGISFRVVCGLDSVAGRERVSHMAHRKSMGDSVFFAGVNGDFFLVRGKASNGSSITGSPVSSCVSGGEIFTTSEGKYQFVIDNLGNAHIGTLDFSKGVAHVGSHSTAFKGVNVEAVDNGITLYTPKFWGSSNQKNNGNCYEVVVEPVDGNKPMAGGKFSFRVVGLPDTVVDKALSNDRFVVHARGNSIENGNTTNPVDFVGSLKPGDVVEFESRVFIDGEPITPVEVIAGNPKNVSHGITLQNEKERPDAKNLHPRTAIGINEDGSKIIMMVVEGRTGQSAGVRTTQLGDILRYAGAYEGLNLDGGGSSTLYTRKLGIRNYCTDGKERAVGNGIFVVFVQ